MSKALLKEHLLIEFLNTPDVDHASVSKDVSNIFDLWRKNTGRNYRDDQLSLAFNAWWLKQCDLHLYRNANRVGYKEFVTILTNSTA